MATLELSSDGPLSDGRVLAVLEGLDVGTALLLGAEGLCWLLQGLLDGRDTAARSDGLMLWLDTCGVDRTSSLWCLLFGGHDPLWWLVSVGHLLLLRGWQSLRNSKTGWVLDLSLLDSWRLGSSLWGLIRVHSLIRRVGNF